MTPDPVLRRLATYCRAGLVRLGLVRPGNVVRQGLVVRPGAVVRPGVHAILACGLLLAASPFRAAEQESASSATRSEATADAPFMINGQVTAGEDGILLLGEESTIDFTDDGEVEEPPRDIASDVIDVQVVNVEVVVTDRDGRTIDGLSREDFTLYEDGRRIDLSNFYAFTDSASATERISPDSHTDELHLVIFVDNLNLRPQSRKLLFESLRSHLREHSGYRIMLVTMSRRFEVVQPFTRDVEKIFAALDTIETQGSLHALFDGARRVYMSRLERASLRFYTPRSGAESDPEFDDAVRVALDLSENARALAEERYQKVESTLEALGGMCDSLGGIPGRKALIYLSDGLPIRPADPLIEAWNGKYQNWVTQSTEPIRNFSRFPGAVAKFNRLMTALGSAEFDLQSEFNRLTIRATDNQVTFYPISNGGRTSDFISAEHNLGAVNDTGSMRRDAQVMENFTGDSALLRMAEDTGGLAVLRNANLGKLLEHVMRDLTQFYSLGYRPQSREAEFRPRKLDVTVSVPGAQVRHIKAHRTKSWRQRLGEKTAAAALFAVEKNPLMVRLAPGELTSDGESYRVPVMIKIPFQQIRLVHQDEFFNAQLTVLVQVRGDQDGLSRPRRFDLPIKIPDSRVLEVLPQVAAYPLELLMPQGPHRVAIGIHDHLARTDATLKYDLVVDSDTSASDASPGDAAAADTTAQGEPPPTDPS
ncbi:MAG: VWA domain-containing protein [Acidobacteriota bacterium]